MKLKDVGSQYGLATSATSLDIEEGAVKKHGNDNDVLHGVFDNDVDPSSLASILPILIHKIKRGRIWNLCDHCSHVCSILLLFPSVCSILSSILLPFFNAISFLFLLQRRKGNMQSITIYKGNTKVWYGLFFFLLPISPLK